MRTRISHNMVRIFDWKNGRMKSTHEKRTTVPPCLNTQNFINFGFSSFLFKKDNPKKEKKTHAWNIYTMSGASLTNQHTKDGRTVDLYRNKHCSISMLFCLFRSQNIWEISFNREPLSIISSVHLDTIGNKVFFSFARRLLFFSHVVSFSMLCCTHIHIYVVFFLLLFHIILLVDRKPLAF